MILYEKNDMDTYITFEIKLLSDTCCGRGEGNGSDVDICVCTDDFGLPELPGRRIKGLLREKALFLAQNGACTMKAVSDLFGDKGGTGARLIMDNARLENADEIAFSVSGYSPREVSSVYIEKRVRTAVNSDGTAKKHSLRTMETVLKGTVFIAEIKIADTKEGDVLLVENALKLLRGIGHNKNRGLGEILCRVKHIRTEEMPDIAYEKRGERLRAEYTIELLQDVVLAAGDFSQKINFISGSALQGVFARFFSAHDEFDTLFFDDLLFSNAYIAAPHRFLPIPFSMKAVKNEDSFLYNEADGFSYNPNVQYVEVDGFGAEQDGVYHVSEPELGMEYHIRKKEQQLFTFSKLHRGQSFQGMIEGSEGALEAVKKAIDAVGGVVKIGASGTAQYGKCRISLSLPQAMESITIKEGETIVAECISDVILCNAWGQNVVNEETLLHAFSDYITYENAQVFAKNGMTGGYNAKWGMPKQRMETYRMGTTVVFFGCRAVTLPESFFIGMRNNEGYGEIRLRKIQQAEWKKEDVAPKKQIIGSAAQNETVQKIEAQRSKKNIALQGAKDAEKAYGKHVGLSGSATMRLLSAYHALVKNGVPENLVEQYENIIPNFSANRELYALSKEVLSGFLRAGSEDSMLFCEYLKNFIGRYKELGQKERKGEKP